MTTTPFHVARGRMGSHEQGLNGQAYVRKLPNGKLVGKFVLETSHGPLVLEAQLEGVKARAAVESVIGRNEMQPVSSGFDFEPLPEAGPQISLAGAEPRHSAARVAARRSVRGQPLTPPNVVVYNDDMARLRAHAMQIQGEEASHQPKHGDAERIYAKLMERDPRAISALRGILFRAQQGDDVAANLWAGICNAHARAHAGDFTRASSAERAAAERLYLRFRRGDPPAVAEVQKIVALAQQGDPGAIRAWTLLRVRHEGDKGAALSGAAVTFSPARVAELLQLVSRARHAPPPFGFKGAPPMFPEEEPLPMGPMPAAPPTTGKYAQYLAEQQAAPTRSLITATGPAAVSTFTFKPATQLSSVRAVALRS